MGPQPVPLPVAAPHDRDAHEGCTVKGKPPAAISSQQIGEIFVLFERIDVAPVQEIELQFRSRLNQEEGLGELLPNEAPAEDGMPCHDLPPSVRESLDVQNTAKLSVQLLQVKVPVQCFEGMEKEPLLHRRKRVQVFDSSGSTFENRKCFGADAGEWKI